MDNRCVILGRGIEIAPVKSLPFSCGWVRLSSELLGIDAIDKKTDDLKVEMDANEKDRIKYEILQFSGSLKTKDLTVLKQTTNILKPYSLKYKRNKI